MINFYEVTHTLRTSAGQAIGVLDRFSGALPKGHYAVLAAEGSARWEMSRLCSGVSAPNAGAVEREGRVSWAIGDVAPFKAFGEGVAAARFFSLVYGFDHDDVMHHIVSYAGIDPELLERPLAKVTTQTIQKIGLSLALLPDFDIYVVEGSVLVQDEEFNIRWLADFGRRLEGKMAIVTTSQAAAVRSLCDAALVLDRGRLLMTRDVAAAAARYGLPRPDVSTALPEASYEDRDELSH